MDSTSEMATQNRTGIHHLPLELLSDVLLSCLPDETFQTPQQNQAPLSVSWVCKSWRAAALSTPRLWSSLHVSDDGRTGRFKVSTIIIPLMELWFSRSLNHPLAISLDLDLEDSILEFLSRHLSRTQNLCIGTVSRFGLNDATIFKSAPILTHITFELLSYSEVLDVLAQCPGIKYLDLATMGLPERKMQTILLPHLSTLILASADFGFLFESLSLPKLSVLKCTVSSHNNQWPQRSFKNLYKRSGFSLTALKLYWFDIRELDLDILLTDICRDLTKLKIQGPPTCVSDYLLDHLRSSPIAPIICPKLDTISLFSCIAVDCSHGALAAMVRSRLVSEDEVEANPRFREAGLVRLRTVKLSNDVDLGEIDEQLDMRESGLVVQVYGADSGDRLS